MRRMKIIPIFLIQNGFLVKYVNLKNHNYKIDHINAVNIFKDNEMDEMEVDL